ncbi:MAG: putative metal-binding motif-containing protein [Myxococcota bacterium]
MLSIALTLLACKGDPPDETGDPTVDADADGFSEADDCNDADADVNPGAVERCNGIDDDCDGTIDSGADDADDFFADDDGDAFGAGAAVSACEAPAGHVSNDGDCNDSDASIHPGADELCDAADRNCDGSPTQGATDTDTWYADADADGYGDPFAPTEACTQPANTVANDDDCDDSDDTRTPNTVWYDDLDFDGYGDNTATTTSCEPPAASAAVGGDCDDTESTVNPGETEVCDGLDNDCDGTLDAALCTTLSGTWTGTFQLGAVEQVGSFIVNNMQCQNGSATLVVDPAATPVVQGTATCTYSGGLGGFSGTQSGTFEGDLAVDGTISGTYLHEYGSNPDDTYSFSGDLNAPAGLDGSGGYYPSSFSAVAWNVTFSSDLTQQ